MINKIKKASKRNTFLLVIALGLLIGAGIFGWFLSAIPKEKAIVNSDFQAGIIKSEKPDLGVQGEGASQPVNEAVSSQSVTMAFFGDMMLDRNVYGIVKKKGNYFYPFEKISSFFNDYDFTIANLEGPVTDNQSVANGVDRMVFTFSPRYLPALKEYFEVLNLANNHTLNFSAKGLSVTRDYLDENGIKYFGDPSNAEGWMGQVVEKNGLKVALIGYHALYKQAPEKVVEEIKKVRNEADFIIVYPHWGIEYARTPSKPQENEAHMFIDAGADLIIGSHPHVVQTIEEYEGKYIFYSLGNFIFDQYFSEETQEGLSVGINLVKGEEGVGSDYNIYPLTISKSSQAELADGKKRQEILDWLADNSKVEDSIKEEIRNGIISGK